MDMTAGRIIMASGCTEPTLMNAPTVGAGYANGLFKLARARGADAARLLQMSGLTLESLEDHDSRIKLTDYMALMRAAQTLCREPALALQYGEAYDLSELSILGLICHASETMLDAFRQMNRYGQLVVEAENAAAKDRFELQRQDGALWIVDNRMIPPGFHELVETSFALMACGTRQFGETPFILEVHVTHPDPGYAHEYERIFRAPIVFEAGWNALQIDEGWLTHRIALQPRYVFSILCAHADRMLHRIESSRTTRGQVERLLMPELHTGQASIDRVSRKMGVSRQTLYRKLKAEGVTFVQILDELRRELALQYLASGKVSVSETAYLLGFSEPAAFSRSFKHWTGQTPREMRQSLARN